MRKRIGVTSRNDKNILSKINSYHIITFRSSKRVYRSVLNLSRLGITDLNDLRHLENISNVEVLSLFDNKIKEIKNLEHFINLKTLWPILNENKRIENLDILFMYYYNFQNILNTHNYYPKNINIEENRIFTEKKCFN